MDPADGSVAEAFKVYARLRPVADGATAASASEELRVASSAVHVRELAFDLDGVWDATASQEAVYARGVRERVASVLAGFNATVLVYGQTGSGKTYTMFSGANEAPAGGQSDAAMVGILPRACMQLFRGLEHASAASPGASHDLRLSYAECYNGTVRDLLADSSEPETDPSHEVTLREGATGLRVDGLSHVAVASVEAVMEAVQHGNARRVVAPMKMNGRSSRGHAGLDPFMIP